MPMITVKDYHLNEAWCDKTTKELFAAAEEAVRNGLNEENEEEIDAFMVDFYKKKPMKDAIKKVTLMIDIDGIKSVQPICSSHTHFPIEVLPKEWKTEIIYRNETLSEDVLQRIRVNETVEEIQIKIEESKNA